MRSLIIGLRLGGWGVFFLRFYFAVARGQPGAHFFWIVMERAHAAAVGDVAAFVNYVEALGPRGVRAPARRSTPRLE